MTYRTHIAAGVLTGLLLSELVPNPLDKLLFVGCAGIGSLLPDVDTEKSYIRRYILFFPRMKHRGHTHSLLGVLIFSLLLIPFGPTAPLTGLIWGYISHIGADSFTVSGIYPFYPYKAIRLRLGTIRTGSIGEQFFNTLCLLGIITYFYFTLRGNT